MGANSAIEWTDHTWNPWWGCQKVSPGCQNCYALSLSKRWGFDIWGPAKTTQRRMMSEAYWKQPIKWNRDAERAGVRKRVFCASMADVFEDHPQLPPVRQRLWELIEATPMLDWLLLTKRPENMTRFAPAAWAHAWPDNIVAMTSVEDQQRANERISELLRVPARRRGLSCEPLLGPVNLDHYLIDDWTRIGEDVHYHEHPALHWIICGGESGHGARPMHQRWLRSLRDQCQAADVAFFFKQHGEWIGGGDWEYDTMRVLEERSLWAGRVGDPDDLPTLHYRVGKHAAGRLLDGRTWDEFPG